MVCSKFDMDAEAWGTVEAIIDSLQTHNNPPSTLQAHRLREYHKICEEHSLRLDDEMSRSGSKIGSRALSEMCALQDQWRSRGEICLAAISPIRNLPPEILGEIFLNCLPEDAQLARRQAPLLLCQICSLWRSIAVSVPQLWCNLSISDDLYASSDVWAALIKSYTSSGKEWLGRAGPTSALSLSLRVHYVDSEPLRDMVNGLIVPHTDRFRNLHLYSQRMSTFSSFFPLPSGITKQLESLVLQFECSDYVGPVTVFESSPHLRRVSISHLMTRESDLGVALPWGQLTHLRITEYLTASRWTFLMSQCVNLQQGEFGVLGVEDNEILPDLGEGVILPHLHTLTVRGLCVNISLFDKIFLPALTKFQFYVELFVQGPGLQWVEPTHFFEQLRSLKSLTLLNQAITAKGLVQLLRYTTSLIELELDNKLEYISFFRSLAFPGRPTHLVPGLETITIYLGLGDLNVFSSHEFVKMVQSRQWADEDPPVSASRLRQVSLYVPNGCRMVLDEVKSLFLPRYLLKSHLVTDLKVVHSSPRIEHDVELAHW